MSNFPEHIKTPITDIRAFIETICVFPSGHIIWLKLGSNIFFHGNVDHSGKFGGWLTRKNKQNDQHENHEYITDLYTWLKKQSEIKCGGVFTLFGMPTDQPKKAYATESCVVSAEMDDGTSKEQWARIKDFCGASGLTPRLVIGSGGKSFHVHFQLDQMIPIETRTVLSQLLCVALQSDPAVTNPHQPMRIAGFSRKREDGTVKPQGLHFHSQEKYTLAEMLLGLSKAFEELRFEFPHDMPDWRWKECRRICAGELESKRKKKRKSLGLPPTKLTFGQKRKQLREVLKITDAEHERQEAERQEKLRLKRERQFLERAMRQLNGEIDLVEEINRVEQSQDVDTAFTWGRHNWKGGGDHRRGCCPWHQSTTGTSGWTDVQNGRPFYHCPTCTDNKGLSPFGYWYALKTGTVDSYPRGKDFVTYAKEFLREHGVNIPDEKLGNYDRWFEKEGNRERGTGSSERGTGNREQETGNSEQGTGNRKQRTGNREQGTGNRERGTGNGEWGIEELEELAIVFPQEAYRQKGQQPVNIITNPRIAQVVANLLGEPVLPLNRKTVTGQFKNHLREFLQQDGIAQIKEFHFCPDPGDVNKVARMGFWSDLAPVLSGLKKQIRVKWWEQLDSGEVHQIDPEKIKIATLDDFYRLARELCGFLTRTQIEDEQAKRQHQNNIRKWIKSYDFTADHKICVKYLTKEILQKYAGKGVILCIKSGLGTNKTGAVGDLLNELECGVFLAGYRNTLLIQTCERWGRFYHLHKDNAFHLVADPLLRFASCVDSSPHVKNDDFEGRTLVIDEPVSVFGHTIHGQTLGAKQYKVLEKLEFFAHDSEMIICADGNFSDYEVDLLRKLAPHKKIITIENTYQEPDKQANIIMTNGIDEKGVKSRDRSHLLKMFNAHEKIVIATDSQRMCEAVDEILTEAGWEGIRIDSETIHLAHVQEFIKDPRAYIKKYQPDYITYSPSLGSGSDINVPGYFNAQFCFFQGVLRTAAQEQLIFRIRDMDIPRYVFCAKYGLSGRYGHNPKSYNARVIGKSREEYLQEFSQVCLEKDQEEINRLSDILKNYRSDDPFEDYYQQIKAREYFEEKNAQECLAQKLKMSGHKVVFQEIEIDDTNKQLLKDTREKLIDIRANQIFNAEDMTEKELLKHGNSIFGGTPEERRKIEKANLKRFQPGIEDTHIWNVDFIREHLNDKSMLSSLRNRYLLNNPETSLNLAQHEWHRLLENSSGFVGDVKSSHLRMEKLLELGVKDLIDSGEPLTKDNLTVRRIYKALKEDFKLRSRVGITVPKERADGSEVMRTIGRVLELLGYKLKREMVTGEDGKRYGVHHIVDKYSEYSDVIEQCYKRYYSEIKSPDKVKLTYKIRNEETVIQQGIQAGKFSDHSTPIYNSNGLCAISGGEQQSKQVIPIYKFRTNQDTPYSSYSRNWFGQPLANYKHEDSVVFVTSLGCHIGYVLELADSGLKVVDDFGDYIIHSEIDVMPSGFMSDYTADRIFENPAYSGAKIDQEEA